MIKESCIPIATVNLIPVLDRLLIKLLRSLSDEEWKLPTIAKLWTVKDIAAHLLDGNLRGLSSSRDNFFCDSPKNINTYHDLVSWLNELNHSWVNATRRISPALLINLLEISGEQYSAHLKTLNPFDQAIYPVAWAGQAVSENWFHIAREYTEKFIHQQQIRDAVGKEGLFTKELFFPFIETFMYALPHTYRDVRAEKGTSISLLINSAMGGQWNIIKTDTKWVFIDPETIQPDVTIKMEPAIAWKLFSKGITPIEALDKVQIIGNKALGQVALQMVSVMA